MKKRRMRIGFSWLSSFLLIVFFAHVAGAVPLLISTTRTVTLGGLTFNNGDLVVYDTDTETSKLFFDGSAFFGHNEDIDGVAFLDEDSIVLSTKGSANIGGLNFIEGDMIRIDLTSATTGTASLYFNGSEYFDHNEDVDAVTVFSDGKILLSTRDRATIGDLTFFKEDLVVFDPSSGTASLFIDGSEIFDDSSGSCYGHINFDAVSVIDSDSIVISTSKTARIGDFIFNDEDLIRIDRSSSTEVVASMYFDGSEHFDNNAHRVDIDAVAIVSVSASALATGEPIPEPATIALLGIGLVGLGGMYLRRKKERLKL